MSIDTLEQTQEDAGSIHALMAAAASVGLGPPSRTPRHVPPSVENRWLHAVAQQKLSGHVVKALQCGALTASSELATAAAALHRQATIRVLQLEQVLLRVAAILAGEGIDLRVLKGPALARTVYAEPEVRSFGDVDVLVRSGDFERATAALTREGFERLLPELRPGFDRRFAKSATFLDERGCQIDLHRTLVVGPFGLLIDGDDLFRTQQTIEVAGRQLPALGPDEQFLNVCYHAALGDVPARLSTLRDVAEMVLHADLDTGRALAIARRWRGQSVIARALLLAWSTLDVHTTHPLVTWARAYRPSPRERQLLACYVSPRRSNSWKYLASARVISGVRSKVAFLWALLLPERRFLDRRADGRHRWWAHGVSSLRRHTGDVDDPTGGRRDQV